VTTEEFCQQYAKDKIIFETWANYVLEKILSQIPNADKILKITPTYRIKDLDSLIAKAFYRNKNYSNPYDDITDKVGMRFVVLLEDDIKTISNIVEHETTWTHSKDRDYEKERNNEPVSFNYQSMHYIVRSTILNYNGIDIPQNIPCEIQIRTLLQHAYSELTHDRVYKNDFDPTKQVQRIVARSMAFLETTDEYFQKVSAEMDNLPIFKLYELLKKQFFSAIQDDKKNISKVNIFILQAYSEIVDDDFVSKITSNIATFDPYVQSNISSSILNCQPIIYFIYYMSCKAKAQLIHKWPLSKEELRPFLTQMGVSMDDRI